MKYFILILILFFAVGCGSYVDSLHRQMDAQNGISRQRPPADYNKFDLYRRGGGTSPHNMQSVMSTSNQKNLNPNTRRQYVPADKIQKRHTAKDLIDNDNDSSLWSGQGKDSFLFTQDSRKKNGDIVLIDVFTRLKNEITAELKRNFPPPSRPAPLVKKKAKDETAKAESDGDKNKPADGEEDASASTDKVLDRISTVVIEEINKDHVLISGRKSILFRNRKHIIELQALVARKDITVDDTIKSDDIIESSILVLR